MSITSRAESQPTFQSCKCGMFSVFSEFILQNENTETDFIFAFDKLNKYWLS